MVEPSVLVGPKRIGPFTVVRRLGAGGMAEAYEGVREGPGGFVQRVCVKRVRPGFVGVIELERLFLREARLAYRLAGKTRLSGPCLPGSGQRIVTSLRRLKNRRPSSPRIGRSPSADSFAPLKLR